MLSDSVFQFLGSILGGLIGLAGGLIAGKGRTGWVILALVIGASIGMLVAYSVENPFEKSEPVIVTPVIDNGKVISVGGSDSITVRLRWGASTPQLSETGADNMVYSLFLDGTKITNLDKYRLPSRLVRENDQGEVVDVWWVYWDVEIGTLSPGEHTVEGQGYLTEDTYDGFDVNPANQKTIWQVTISVRE